MPAISISDDQRERLRWVQRRLGDDIEYGHVRPRDALEYLLDRFDEADDEPGATDAATAVSEPAGGSAAEQEPGEETETMSAAGSAVGETAGFAVVNGGGVSVVEKNGVFGETTDEDDRDDEDRDEADGDVDHDRAGGDGAENDDEDGDDDHDRGDGDDAEGDGDAEQADDGTDGDASDGSADGDDAADGDGSADGDDEARLNSVMSLLDDHDDRWSEASGGEEKYEVDLPDGTTERARTKDDVRALLFQHYR